MLWFDRVVTDVTYVSTLRYVAFVVVQLVRAESVPHVITKTVVWTVMRALRRKRKGEKMRQRGNMVKSLNSKVVNVDGFCCLILCVSLIREDVSCTVKRQLCLSNSLFCSFVKESMKMMQFDSVMMGQWDLILHFASL